MPNYYVRGAITQLDSGVIAESIGIGIEQTNPEVVALVRDRFASMSGQERVSFAQRALNGQGLDQVDQLLSASARGNLASSRVSVTVTD